MDRQAIFGYGETKKESLCVRCRGFMALCGRRVCPILVKAKTYLDLKNIRDSIAGSAPPAVFVGSYGYPRVIAGPLIPPLIGDTMVMDSEKWLGLGFDDILRYRFQLIRSKSVIDIASAREPSGVLEKVQEMVLSDRPVDAEATFEKKPDSRVAFSMREAPAGPSAELKSFSVIDNPSVPAAVDRVTSDTDYKAAPAVLDLFKCNIDQRQITRLFSVGLLGEKNSRRLVPTGWSITAVDDIIGRGLIEKVKCYPTVDKYQVFSAEALANNVCVLLMPTPWMFEGLELWHISAPNWHVDSDYELYDGRKDYASSLAGAYYAARLPVAEHLYSIRRQAGAIAFMEVLNDWIPLGVWRFRELAKEALSRPPQPFDTLEEALKELEKRLRSPIRPWLEASRLYRLTKEQKLLSDFF
ncbi:Nre family DNA repair protein [Methanocella conradii]|uniref:Nre family DNA repair protein n=1 Tax=Methanocella conradii TaxID=1175444 RepID=UPI00157CF7F4|nr:Nre family DNA repair protein [Methanocella conradii]